MEHPHSHPHDTAAAGVVQKDVMSPALVPGTAKDCCDAPADKSAMHQGQKPSGHAQHGSHGGSLSSLTTSATIHCLTGCAIGEFVGLAIGVSLGWSPWPTMILATVLGFASGYTLGLRPLVKQGMTWTGAFKTIWLGETISIAVMEFAMNFTDYHVGGVQAASILAPQFWLGYVLALPAGFVAAWPVNWWLLRNNVKQRCH